MKLGRAGFDVKSTNRSYGSDHVSFQRAGYPAILLIEADDTVYPNYHKSTDVVSAENVNYDQCMVIMTGLLNTAVEYAQTTTL